MVIMIAVLLTYNDDNNANNNDNDKQEGSMGVQRFVFFGHGLCQPDGGGHSMTMRCWVTCGFGLSSSHGGRCAAQTLPRAYLISSLPQKVF